MKNKNGLLSLRMAPRAAGFALATILPLAVNTASAFELNLGAVKGSLDTTLSYGTGWRMEDQDKRLAAQYATYTDLSNAHNATFANKNDGDANFDNDSTPIASVFKITSDFELKYDNYGAFVRGTAFYDSTIMDETPNRSVPNKFQNCRELSSPVLTLPSCGYGDSVDDHSGHDARFLDAYVYGNFDISGHALNVRLGEQVISWGEALFLQDGINSANPVSLSKLRLPGAEVKEALLPLPMLYASMELTSGLTAETFYEFDWDYSEADDRGTYYSTDDAFAGFGSEHVLIAVNSGAPYPNDKAFLTADRLTDKSVDGKGQYGVAFRYSLENTEFGLFYMNYHSHKPVAQTTSGKILGGSPAQQAAQLLIGSTYSLVYPEDIQMVGLSFSTTVGDLSVSGELAYRPNDVILSELGDNLVAYNNICAAAIGTAAYAAASGCYYGPSVNGGKKTTVGSTVVDAVELETYNMDLVLINNFGPTLGADGLTGVLEFGGSYIPAGEDQRYASTASLLNIPLSQIVAAYPLVGGGICGTQTNTESGACVSEGPSNDYLDNFSWGYRAVLSATYNDVFAGVALSPMIRFAHDVDGNSHRSGNFLENRKAATAGLNALYNQAFEVGVAYNAFWGAENSNLLHDRDNITATLKYSF